MRPRRIEIWSDLQCDGGTRLAVLRGTITARETRRVRALPQLSLNYPASATAHAQMREWRVIRFDYSDSAFDEWVIVKVGEIRDNLTVDLDCMGPGVKLANVVVSRSDADGSMMYDFEAPSLTPTQQINNFVLPAPTAAGMHFTLGSIDPSGPCDMRYGFGQDAGWDSALSALQRLATLVRGPTGAVCEINIRRNGTSGYFVDLVYQIGASASTFDVRFLRNMPAGWKRNRTTDRQATRVLPRGAEVDGVAATMARARWKVSAIAGSDLTLVDPAGSDGPIGFDNQLNGFYVLKKNGTLTQISASVSSTQKVTVASVANVAVDDLIEIRRTSAGDWLTYLDHPTNVAVPPSGYGIISRPLPRPDIPGTVNLGDNTVCREYSGGGATLPDRWTKVGASTITKNISDFTRIRYGPASFRMQGTADGDGADTPYTAVIPTAPSPLFPGFMGFWLEAGQVRVEFIAAKDPISVSSITRSGTIATATTGSAHGLAKGGRVEVLGADQSEYNGIRLVTSVPTSTTFTYVVVGTPTTPATGTITSAWCRRLPDGTEGWAGTNATKQWKELGVNDQVTNLNALGVTRTKFRIVQDGSTACDVYVNYYQITQTPTQQPFVEGGGPTKLWQEANRYLKAYSVPFVSYEGPAISLQEIDPVTWQWGTAAPTLGGGIRVSDPDGYGTVVSRILAYSKDPFSPALHQLTLSDDPGDLIDILVGDRRPKALPKSVSLFTDPDVDWALLRRPNSPGAVEVRLSTRPAAGATAYYWVGAETDDPPSPSVVQAGPPSDTAWGTYAQPFSIDQVQDADLRVWVYCVSGNNRSRIRWFRVDRDTLPEISSLQLQENPSLSVQMSWDPDDDVRTVRIYSDVGTWPVEVNAITSLTRASSVARAVCASAHHLETGDWVKVTGATGSAYNIDATVTVIDSYTFDYTISGTPTTPDPGSPVMRSGRNPLDETKFNVEKAVDPNGGGYTSAGTATTGGTSYTKSGYSAADVVYVVAAPIDWRGLVGPPEYRGVGKIVMAAAATPSVGHVTANRTANGSACDTTDGAQYSFAWDEFNLVDGVHKVVVIATIDGGGEYSATETNPHSNHSKTVRIPFKVTIGKIDPLISVSLSWSLLDGSDFLIQSGSIGTDSFKSSCAL